MWFTSNITTYLAQQTPAIHTNPIAAMAMLPYSCLCKPWSSKLSPNCKDYTSGFPSRPIEIFLTKLEAKEIIPTLHPWGKGGYRFTIHYCSTSQSVQLFATPWTAAHQASLSFTISQSLLKLMSIESVVPSNHLILCHPLLLLPSIFPSNRVFSNESALHIRWPKYWSFSFNISPSSEGLIHYTPLQLHLFTNLDSCSFSLASLTFSKYGKG